MKLKYILPFILFQTIVGFSQKIDFKKSIFTISDSLRQHANTVIRDNKTEVSIHSKKNMTITYSKLITVLNANGNKPFFSEQYDKHKSIKNIKITIYNKFGKIIKKVKSKEIDDFASASDNYTLFTDDRYKYYKYIPKEYPYTIEINYVVKSSNTAFIPKWYAYEYYYTSVQQDAFKITYPEDLTLNYKENNFDFCRIIKENSKGIIQYKTKNLKAITPEPYSPNFSDIFPNAYFGLETFSLAGEIGNASNWNEFGKWMNEKLLRDRNEIPEATKNDIKKLVKGIENPIERAKLIYQYMQNRTRYISVQIGIGGWKPMKAKDVDKLGYGDCKALSYYTKSLLKEANIEAEYTVIYSGDKKNIDKDLVSVQGNHVILMLPTKKDTIWLECTSQKLPFGQTGDTDDRDAMIIQNGIGKIVHTNKYTAKHNQQKIQGDNFIDNKGNLKSKIKISSFGKQYNNHFGIIYKTKKKQIEHYKNLFSTLIDIKIDSVSFENDKKNIVFKEFINLTSQNFAEIIGNDMILKINAYNIYPYLPKRIKNRKQPLYLSTSFFDEDEITIHIPNNFKSTTLPKDIAIKNQFGYYKVSISKRNETELIYKRQLLINEGIFPRAAYNSFRNFIKEVIKSDKQKIILSKK